MRFCDILGHDAVKTHLIDIANSDKVPPSQLFLGNDGSAGFAIALAFASYLNCTNIGSIDSCGLCPSCRKTDNLIHPDLVFSFPSIHNTKFDADDLNTQTLAKWRTFVKKNPYITIDDWIEVVGIDNKQLSFTKESVRRLIELANIRTFEARYKVVFIWMPEYLNTTAGNALLKILEEPPKNTLFFLIGVDTHKMLDTIVSRMQKVYVGKFTDIELLQLLNIHYNTDDVERISQVISLAEGNYSNAIKLLNSHLDLYFGLFRDWMRSCYKCDNISLVNKADSFNKMTKENQKNFFLYSLSLLREILINMFRKEKTHRIVLEEEEFITKFGNTFDRDKIKKIAELLNDYHYYIERDANSKILFLNLSLTISNIFKSPENL